MMAHAWANKKDYIVVALTLTEGVKFPESVISIQSDVTSDEHVKAMKQKVAALLEERDAVLYAIVNNAGIALAGRLDHVPRDHWETLMRLNLMAPMRLCSEFLPGMIERGSGHIVNISSIAGWTGAEGLSSYCASKFGLRGFGTALAADLRGTGVHVTNIYPCFSRTPILDSPQHGYEDRRVVPEYLISDPAQVVARIIDGVRRNRVHVFPDKYARIIKYLAQLAPWALPLLDRRMQAQSIAAGKAGD